MEEEEDQQGREVEVVCLSQAWSVFESLLRQLPASQVSSAKCVRQGSTQLGYMCEHTSSLSCRCWI